MDPNLHTTQRDIHPYVILYLKTNKNKQITHQNLGLDFGFDILSRLKP